MYMYMYIYKIKYSIFIFILELTIFQGDCNLIPATKNIMIDISVFQVRVLAVWTVISFGL